LLMGYAPQSLRATWITFGILVAYLLVATLFLFRSKIFRRKQKKSAKE
ncbi:MAG: hypothetical protein HUK16_08820, partial [Bacteroidales bacterium]|nr:hypothetical protein [Bacteroidales bacterium]